MKALVQAKVIEYFWIFSKRSIRKKKLPLVQRNSGTRSDNDYFLFRLEERIFPGWWVKLSLMAEERLLLTLSGSVWGFIGKGQMKESMWEYMSVPQAQKYHRLTIAVCLLPGPSFSDIKMVIVFAVDITLDLATAHPSLFLSEGNRCVTWGEKS